MTLPLLPNAQARRLFLHRHALAEPPSGPATGADLAALIRRIGFVQVDSINTVERAHHMILWSRRQSYRPASLKRLLERDRALWEHWTHDASILPVETFPYWRHRFARDADRLHGNWRKWFRDGYEAQFDRILNHIAAHGPVTSAEVSEGEARGKGGWWDWHPSKTALEWLWRTGQLSITRREGFQKVYDLTERVIPEHLRQADPDFPAKVDWACRSALDHLGFATPSEVQAYWNAIPKEAVGPWVKAALARGEIVEVLLEGADGSPRKALVRPEVLAEAPDISPRLRILSPFDPALRDRARADHLFGFYYRIEVFVPEPKRRWGYYVFPVLEGDRLVGRLDAKAFKAESVLRVRAFWPEVGVRLTKVRLGRLEAELHRLAKFAGCDRVEFLPGWQRDFLAP
ncbi:winged helix-turn-helix domain-containing protein [Tabrizicola oligotrophica]|uniref:Winged helix-turn-helix domain-containing protein n=1 Tax=Tabrizicola oligotrophica TaxID=2710650 RepID=A0A6M0QUB9_9RHOB|nr:crosslink repair DNA glycosylase YcaQ family protein [Tabrizicola oligotrophica]NEY90062.1 winged helix-turn-helix domain-containing protein [Tabrizicola oligotrophica]